MGGFILFIIVATVILAFISAVAPLVNDHNEGQIAKEKMDNLINENNMTYYEWQLFNGGQILLDNTGTRMLWIIEHNGYISRHYHNITDVKLIIDDTIEYRSSLTSAVGRAAIGGLALGGVGAIIGGVTGKKHGKKMVHKIELVLSYNNSVTPYSSIVILDEKGGIDLDSEIYLEAYKQGMYWSKKISSLSA
ncbi:hypothetical protein [Planococcus citreus]|uniref:Uncharacterized protein n=1 Tax=Planococcus citreus TaxID=1373 RepID=A0A497YLP1_9BACL|nr:hypothetical protein [Planococcus citreus]RLJ90680.1 hypothetical protein DFR62_0827 [Planococcus citreus]